MTVPGAELVQRDQVRRPPPDASAPPRLADVTPCRSPRSELVAERRRGQRERRAWAAAGLAVLAGSLSVTIVVLDVIR